MDKKNEYLIQITSGRGPEECWRVVAKVLDIFLSEARLNGKNLHAEVISKEPGHLKSTLLSATILLRGADSKEFISNWKGTIQWISQSPYRKFHKRKNWFVGVEVFEITDMMECRDRDITFESLRASGPGGQHVNKTESAVRAKHLPSGISVVASERRSQHQNKSEALERLKNKVKQWNVENINSKLSMQWQQHNSLERGNAVRVFEDRL